MATVSEQLELIREKVNRLGKLNQDLASENALLRQELQNLKELAESQKNTVKELEEKNKIIKIADTVSLAAREKRELKLKINQYVREIDRCIALLND